MTHRIQLRDQSFDLHPLKAAFWLEQNMLLIADAHLGKVMHFRKHGSAVPKAAIQANFDKLDALVSHYQPASICFLGDLFHSHRNVEWELFANWRKAQPQRVLLITGNHDIIDPKRIAQVDIEQHQQLQLADFLLTHHPTEHDSCFNFCGHIHPAVRMVGPAKQYLTLPCFFQRPGQLIFPAFGAFTGLHRLVPQAADSVYVVLEDVVRAVQTA